MSSHCGNRFACHNVLRLFIASTKPSIQPRRFSSTLVEHVKSQETTPKLYDYHQKLRAHVKMFKTKEAQIKAEAVLDDMKQHGVQPNHQTYLHLVMGLSWQRHRNREQNDRMESWFYEYLNLQRNKKRKRPQVKLKKILQSIAHYGHPNLKTMFIKMLDLYEHELDIECWHSVITGCINAKRYEDAEYVLELARKRKLAIPSSYHLLIRTYLSLRDQKSASRIFAFMLQDQIVADYSIYASFIQFYTSLQPNWDTFETVKRLWQALLFTAKEEIPHPMIHQLLKYFRKNFQLAVAEQIYLDLKSRKQRLNEKETVEMNKVIVGFAHWRQLPSALSLVYDLLGEGYKLDARIICRILEACIARKDREAAQRLVNILEEVQPSALNQSCYDVLKK